MRTDRRAGRRTDMTKLIVAFRNFTKAPKNGEGGTEKCFTVNPRYKNIWKTHSNVITKHRDLEDGE
jgi:hypothetical protein